MTNQIRSEQKNKIFLAAKILTTVLLAGLFVFFLTNKEWYINGETLAPQSGKIIRISLITVITLVLLWIKNKWSDRVNTILLIGAATVAGVLNFLGMELVSGDLSQLRHLVGMMNLIIIYFVMLTIFAVCNRIKPAVITTSLIMYVFAIGNYFTNLFRGIPVLASDLILIKTAASVAGEFEYKIDYDVFTYTLFLILIMVLLAKIPEKEHLGRKLRLGYLGGYTVILICFLYGCVFSNTLEKLNVDVQPFDPNRSYKSNGSVLTFIRSCQMVRIDKPEGYDADKVKEAAEQYIQEYNEDTKEYKTPNVIVIASEALSDLQSITPFATNQDVMPVIHSLSENTIKGTAYSSIFGGKTANSEYEFLTGHSTAFLNDVVPFQFLIKQPTSNINTYLKNSGYEGFVAIHPHYRRGYNRDVTYDNLGFEKFTAIEDMTGDHHYIRNRISDIDATWQVIREYEKLRETSDAPAYFYLLTMQNHSPYNEPYENFTPDIEVLNENLKSFELEQYLSLVKASDAAFGELINYFSNVDEETILVIFGDHQPKLDNSTYAEIYGQKVSKLKGEDTMLRYGVPYVIWANYDIEEKDYGDISLNYLSTIMMEAAGMKLTPYNRFVRDLRQEIPVFTAHGYIDKEQKYYDEVNEESPYKDLLDLYEFMQYNNLMDSKNRVENFFD